jgi:hypothetical protein
VVEKLINEEIEEEKYEQKSINEHSGEDKFWIVEGL